MWLALTIALPLLVSSSDAFAVQPDEVLSNPQLEARARVLSRELRCMVCQNQSIDDSDAPLARDLRILVRERLTAGDSDQKVLDFLVKRYGEFVLLRPRFEWSTVLLWSTPVIVLVIGAGLIGAAWRRRLRGDRGPAERAATDRLSDAETARLAKLMGSTER